MHLIGGDADGNNDPDDVRASRPSFANSETAATWDEQQRVREAALRRLLTVTLLMFVIIASGSVACVFFGVTEIISNDGRFMNDGLGEVLTVLGIYFSIPCLFCVVAFMWMWCVPSGEDESDVEEDGEYVRLGGNARVLRNSRRVSVNAKDRDHFFAGAGAQGFYGGNSNADGAGSPFLPSSPETRRIAFFSANQHLLDVTRQFWSAEWIVFFLTCFLFLVQQALLDAFVFSVKGIGLLYFVVVCDALVVLLVVYVFVAYWYAVHRASDANAAESALLLPESSCANGGCCRTSPWYSLRFSALRIRERFMLILMLYIVVVTMKLAILWDDVHLLTLPTDNGGGSSTGSGSSSGSDSGGSGTGPRRRLHSFGPNGLRATLYLCVLIIDLPLLSSYSWKRVGVQSPYPRLEEEDEEVEKDSPSGATGYTRSPKLQGAPATTSRSSPRTGTLESSVASRSYSMKKSSMYYDEGDDAAEGAAEESENATLTPRQKQRATTQQQQQQQQHQRRGSMGTTTTTTSHMSKSGIDEIVNELPRSMAAHGEREDVDASITRRSRENRRSNGPASPTLSAAYAPSDAARVPAGEYIPTTTQSSGQKRIVENFTANFNLYLLYLLNSLDILEMFTSVFTNYNRAEYEEAMDLMMLQQASRHSLHAHAASGAAAAAAHSAMLLNHTLVSSSEGTPHRSGGPLRGIGFLSETLFSGQVTALPGPLSAALAILVCLAFLGNNVSVIYLFYSRPGVEQAELRWCLPRRFRRATRQPDDEDSSESDSDGDANERTDLLGAPSPLSRSERGAIPRDGADPEVSAHDASSHTQRKAAGAAPPSMFDPVPNAGSSSLFRTSYESSSSRTLRRSRRSIGSGRFGPRSAGAAMAAQDETSQRASSAASHKKRIFQYMLFLLGICDVPMLVVRLQLWMLNYSTLNIFVAKNIKSILDVTMMMIRASNRQTHAQLRQQEQSAHRTRSVVVLSQDV